MVVDPSHWPSTVGLALIAAFWVFVIIMIFLGLVLGMMVMARAKTMRSGTPLMCGVLLTSLVPVAGGAGAAAESHPFWSIGLSLAAVIFSLWWLNNMAKREP